MQEAEEQDTCRICSAPAEPDQPLFHPCKCSGTIRYIHQDCLTTWLAHSKKKDCDVCKHPYSFNKVYASDMPARLPPVLLLRHLARQLLFAILFTMRAIVVGVVWLAILPWVTVWTWRMYFTMGDSTAWWISDKPRPPPAAGQSSYYYNLTVAVNGSFANVSSNATFLARMMSHPSWRTMSSDIFTGQIIASLIVLTFVTVFLLREWISQNARPGVFDDEEVPPLDDREIVPQQAPPAPAPLPQVVHIQPQPQPHPQVVPRIEAPRFVPPRPATAPPLDQFDSNDNEHDFLAHRKKARLHGVHRIPPERSRNGKGRDVDLDDYFDPELRIPPLSRRRLQSNTDGNPNVPADISDHEDLWSSTLSRREERATSRTDISGNGSSADEMESYEFTFRATVRLPSRRKSRSMSPAITPPFQFDEMDGTVGEQARDEPRYAEDRSVSPSSSSSPGTTTSFKLSETLEMEKDFPSAASTSYTPDVPRRPPLPTTALPASDTGALTPPPQTSSKSSAAQTPLASPSLATYCAPEELEAGPSRLAGYFDQESQVRKAMEEEHSLYFRDLDENDGVVEREQADEDGQGIQSLALLSDDDDDDGAEETMQDMPPLALLESDESDDDEEEGQQNGEFADVASDGEMDEEGDNEDEEDDDEGEEREDRREIGVVNIAQVQPAQAPAEVALAQDVNDDLDGNIEDDMEGAMEAIGLRGPIHGVVQNAALMIFVLDSAIGLGVWLPFTIGKSTALLSLDPQRFLQILHLPIRAMRIVTDPIVDTIMFLLVRVFLPAVLRTLHRVSNVFLYSILFLVAKVLGQEAADKTFQYLAWVYFERPWEKVIARLASPKPSAIASETSGTGRLVAVNAWFVHIAEPYFALLGKEVRVYAERLYATWTRLAMGQGTSERVFAIILGYAVVGVLLALYLNVLTVGNVKNAGKAVRGAVRQQLLVAKVAAFIIIELVIFPLGCGLKLDLCTIWLFPEATLQSRALFFLQAPMTAMFYHWVAGTMFMYQFAILLAACRSIMRPGAMWFIKDPQDQNFHPIRDILDRPTLTQLRKLLVSAVMYAFVVMCGVASVAGLLLLGSKSILPFRWKNREPLSNVPIDLLFLHMVLPYTMHYFRPKKALQKGALHVWKYLASRLRLTSYMFGERRDSEEYTPKHLTWSSLLLDSGVDVHDPEHTHDGSFRRVPATDHIALPRDMRATAEVDENGEPADDNARQLISMQDAEAEKAKRVVNDDYKIVYIPPQFRYRILVFIFLLWIIGSISAASLVALPIQLGRMFFRLFTSRDVHDGYSFIVGFYLLWACYLFGRAVDRMDRRRQRRGGDGPRGQLPLYVAKHGLIWLAKVSYMAFFLGVVIPTLVALVVELYVILPIRLTWNPAMAVRIRIVDMWALGLLYIKIGFRRNRLQPRNRAARGLIAILDSGWTNPNPVSATRELILPVVSGLIAMILLPAVLLRGFQYFFPILSVDDKFLFKHIYPGIFAVAGFSRSLVVMIDVLSTWAQSIRDKEFLVEMRLRNHEPEREKVNREVGGAKDAEDYSDN